MSEETVQPKISIQSSPEHVTVQVSCDEGSLYSTHTYALTNAKVDNNI